MIYYYLIRYSMPIIDDNIIKTYDKFSTFMMTAIKYQQLTDNPYNILWILLNIIIIIINLHQYERSYSHR